MSLFFGLSYLAVEYLRPQTMIASLSGLPIALILIIGLMVSFFLERKKFSNRNVMNKLLLAYLSWFAVCCLFAKRPELTVQSLIDMAKIVIIYFLLINTINEKNRLYLFTVLLILLNFKYAQYAVRIWVTNGFYTDPRGFYDGGGFGIGFFGNPNDFGAAMNCIFGICVYVWLYDARKLFGRIKVRWIHAMTCLTIPIAILASSSRGALLSFCSSLIVIIYKGKRKIALLLTSMLIILILVLLIPADNWQRLMAAGSELDGSSQTRIHLWAAGIRMMMENPLFGVGPNNFIYVNQNVYSSSILHVQHNIFIQAASELGFPGLMILIIIIVYCFCSQNKTRKILKENHMTNSFLFGLSHGIDICIVAFAVNGLFITILYYPFFWMLLVISTALQDVALQMVATKEGPCSL